MDGSWSFFYGMLPVMSAKSGLIVETAALLCFLVEQEGMQAGICN